MKEIKAYVHRERVADVIAAIKDCPAWGGAHRQREHRQRQHGQRQRQTVAIGRHLQPTAQG